MAVSEGLVKELESTQKFFNTTVSIFEPDDAGFAPYPEKKCVELKSLKLYLQQFRNEGIFYEHVTNRILDDLVAVLQPRRIKLLAEFTARGGIQTNVTATYQAKS